MYAKIYEHINNGRIESLSKFPEIFDSFDEYDDNGWNPLTWSIFARNKESFLFFLKRTDVSKANSTGMVPLMIASTYYDMFYISKILDKNGTNINAQDKFGNTALIHAAPSGTPELLDLLIPKGADVNVVNNSNNNAAIVAVMKGNVEFAASLVLNGTSLSHKNNEGYSLMDIVERLNYQTAFHKFYSDQKLLRITRDDAEYEYNETELNRLFKHAVVFNDDKNGRGFFE